MANKKISELSLVNTYGPTTFLPIVDPNVGETTRILVSNLVAGSPHTHTFSDLTDGQEAVEDHVAALFAAGTHTGVTVTYTDNGNAAGALSLAVTGGGGTVTSVDLTAPPAGITVSGGPVTTSGSITLALADDLAALESLTGTNTIYYRSGASAWSPVTIGTGLTFTSGTLSATGGGGTPGGASGQLQWNDNGTFAGTTAATYATSGTHFTITAQATTDVPLTLQMATGQTAPLFRVVQDDGTTVVCQVDKNGYAGFGAGTYSAPLHLFCPASGLGLRVERNGRRFDIQNDGTNMWLGTTSAHGWTLMIGGQNVITFNNTAQSVGFLAGKKVGFFGATPVDQQPGGAATASNTYGTTEQEMLQKVYDALRNLGLMS